MPPSAPKSRLLQPEQAHQSAALPRLTRPLIDAHCHLENETFGPKGVDEAIERALAQGIVAMVAIGASSVAKGAHEASLLCRRHGPVWASVGIHPNDAHHATQRDMDEILALLRQDKVVCLGEVGLDYHYGRDHQTRQQEIFKAFLMMAKRCQKPIMLHVRDAHDDALKLIDEVGLPAAGGMVHCFTAGLDVAQEYLKRDMMLSIPGVATFKNAHALHEAIASIPLDKLLIETDTPYLAPAPLRGARNEPAYLVHTALRVAALKGVPPDDLAQVTSDNACRFFNIAL